jgi:hypothetical protein
MRNSMCMIDIDIDVATNPSLRDMFTRPEACKDVLPFLRGLDLATSTNGRGEVAAIELTGPADALSSFASKFLGDECPQVYSLSYRD